MSKPPPIPLYPKRYDNDETLFLVYNTSESILSEDCPAWSEEISVRPLFDHEVWADSGYASIDGELFYYNSVERSYMNLNQPDSDSGPTPDLSKDGYLVTKFKGCVRNLGGSQTRFNKRGTKVRGFVVAEHHNQLVDAIINTERFIGTNFSEDQDTLDWKIRNLSETPIIFDDHSCPEVSFIFNIISQDNATGIVAEYNIVIENSSLDTNFVLDFGDGVTNNFLLEGTHTYSVNSNIDPVLTVANSFCSIVVTPTIRESSLQPTRQETGEGSIEIPLPPPPVIPPITITPFVQLDNRYNIPPIVFPCLDASPIGDISIPSIIEIVPPLNIPTLISISPVTIPTRITISPSAVSIPTFITITPIDIPSKIELPSVIQILQPNPSIPTFISISPIDIPSRIEILAPDLTGIPTYIDIPTRIEILTPDLTGIPTYIDIPTRINIDPVNIPTYVKIDQPFSLPTYIKVDSPIIDIPSRIDIPSIVIPSFIDSNIPSTITIDPIQWNVPSIGPVDVNINLFGSITSVISLIGPSPAIPSIIKIEGEITSVITVDWEANGGPPQLSCIVTVECGSSPSSSRSNLSQASLYNQDYVEVDVASLGIPSVIKVESPVFPDLKINTDNIPTSIKVDKIEGISEIKITQDFKVPSEIKIVSESFIPTSIVVESKIPEVIQLKNYDIPEFIPVKVQEDFPKEILLNASSVPKEIQVVGVPSVIQLQGYIPSAIQLVMPENPEIELVYKGSPIDVKVELDLTKLNGDGNKTNCVSIVPCQ
jgi:hypothetical protein